MNRQFISGASYVDALPTGEYCALYFGSHVETHLGDVKPAAPEQGPLFLRCTNVVSFRFAGQQHEGMGALEWSALYGWRVIPPPACGASPVIYDAAGLLHVSDCSIGSQGYRYVRADGTLATGDQTYYDGPSDLSEWSEYGGLKIGQGHSEGGVIVWDGSKRRLLESGPCTFIRVQGVVDRVSIAFVRPDGAVIIRATLDELRSLPIVPSSGTVAPIPGPPVVIPQPPKPEPSPMSVPASEIARLGSSLRKFAGLLVPNTPCFPFCVAVATDLGGKWGLNGKRGNASDPSRDILAYLDAGIVWLFDVIGDAADPNDGQRGANHLQIPTNSDVENHPNGNGAIWLDPKAFASSNPGVPPVGGATSGTSFYSVGSALDALLDDDHTRIAKIDAAVAEIRKEIAALKLSTSPAPSFSLNGQRIALKADTGKYVSADQARGPFAPLVADRDAVGGWETFTIEAQP